MMMIRDVMSLGDEKMNTTPEVHYIHTIENPTEIIQAELLKLTLNFIRIVDRCRSPQHHHAGPDEFSYWVPICPM